ncbi:MAG: alanine racemase, partial [Deltaproteobacteria bacterium]|nr:alanine racemase [Deltaproteobacteria bacterium]
MNLFQLETPALILDRGKIEKNISSLHKQLEALQVNLRPHGKTAKNIDILRSALAGQAGGITVSTIKEAEYYFEHGIVDITYAVGIAPVKLERLVKLIKKGAEISLLVDSIEQVGFVAARAQAHSLSIPVLIEIDCDGQRSGVSPDDPLLLEIGRLLHSENGVVLKGVLTHAGGSYQC